MTRSLYAAAAALAILAASPLAHAGRTPSGPIVCKRNRSLMIENRSINASKDGLTVKGNCSVVLRNSRIVAGRHAINLRQNGRITIEKSYVQGKKSALRIGGNGSAKAKGSTLVGRIQSKGNGHFEDLGGNTFGKPGAEAGPPPPGGRKRYPATVCKGNTKLTLTKRQIETKGNGLVLRGNCRLTVIDCRILAGKLGVVVRDNAKLVLDKSYVRGKQAALRVLGNGTVNVSNTTFVGGVRKSASAKYEDGGGNTKK